MKSKAIVCAIAALSMGFSGLALAQNDKDNRGTMHPDEHAQRQERAPDHGRPPMRDDHARDHDRGPGAGPDHAFYRGGRLPNEYRNHQYVVDDWRGHHLNAPPRGYQWVQTGSDYVLVAITTGIIASILLNH